MASLSAANTSLDGASAPGRTDFVLWRPWVQLWLSVAAGAALLLGVLLVVGLGNPFGEWCYYASLAIGLVYGLHAATIALAEKRVDIDVLMVVGAVMAAAVHHAEEGALLLVLFTFAGALEELAMARTQREIRALHGIMPDRAIALRGGEWTDVTPESLAVGEEIRIRPGDRVPVDALILEGVSSVDESTLTGESVPRAVEPGAAVYAGTINGEAVLRARVAKLASESSVQRVLAMVTEAREQREPLQRTIDRVGQPYTLLVLGLSSAVFLVWRFALGVPAADAVYTAITLLIVASPCALVIATPTATLSAIARGARAGVLFKGGESIDRLSRTRAVCFDKTGTLTKGRPIYREIRPRDGGDAAPLLALAAQLERDSTHPTAKAILQAGEAAGALPSIDQVRSIAGRGMAGQHGGVEARVGNLAFVGEIVDAPARAWLEATLRAVREQGQLGVAIATGAGACAVLVLRDEIRVGAAELVRQLHALDVRPVRMLTGDDEVVAKRVAEELGLDAYDASLLPEQKVAAVEAMKREHAGRSTRSGIAVIGDGVNDAPALAAADVSIAVGSIGSDAALESADIVLLSDDLTRVPWALRLARATRKTVAVNLVFALSVIVVMGLVVVIGSRTGLKVPMAVGVLAHEGGTVAVVLNSIRLLWFASAPAGR
ncbi:MAG: cation-translocating P-type ATPase [Phycisphaerales bacterium]|nr:cation-translocating P-type ATPase [Phycisphaerales bacterium]